MDVIVGIDLGTTNSEISYVQDGRPHVIRDEDGQAMLPSCVGLAKDGRLLVGAPARNQWLLAPDRTVRSIKRKMGQDVRVRLGRQQYTPQEISAIILRSLRQRASRHLGCQVRRAVITVPAYFNDAQRQATRQAGELAGLEVVRIVNEPTAASLTYDTDQQQLKRVLVYDLGGGTFDVSIVQVEEGVVEVLCSHGDTELGGDDFDRLLAEHIAQRFEKQHQVALQNIPAAWARLVRAAEEAKKKLSFEPFATVQEEYIAEQHGKPLHLEMELARTEFEQLIRPLLDKTITCVGKALDDANLTPSQLDKVLLVGGSTRIPLVSELLEERLGQPAHQEVHPDLCVALGAAIQAAMISGLDVGPVLVDITPHSLGISCIGEIDGMLSHDLFSPIIPRNTALPASRSKVYYTAVDGQECVHIEVYQGEDPNARKNMFVGDFYIEGLSKAPAGDEIVAHMKLTLDGTLEVTASEKRTGLSKRVRMENALARFRRERGEAARQRIDQLFDRHQAEQPTAASRQPASAGGDEDDGQQDALNRSLVQATALMEKGEKLMPHISEQDRQEVSRRIERLRQAVQEQRLTELQTETEQLADLIYYLEQ